jgi:predicted SnoaL-like aldol condensation-catalyzing enzyme
MTNKEIALGFLTDISSGKVFEAYEKYASIEFKHHNLYYKGDLISLRNGMYQSEQNFPNKTIEIKNMIAEDDKVMMHFHVKLAPHDAGFIIAHIYKIKEDKIVEMWDFGQQIPEEYPNENGPF